MEDIVYSDFSTLVTIILAVNMAWGFFEFVPRYFRKKILKKLRERTEVYLAAIKDSTPGPLEVDKKKLDLLTRRLKHFCGHKIFGKTLSRSVSFLILFITSIFTIHYVTIRSNEIAPTWLLSYKLHYFLIFSAPALFILLQGWAYWRIQNVSKHFRKRADELPCKDDLDIEVSKQLESQSL